MAQQAEAPTENAAAAIVNDGAKQLVTTSLYVEDLDQNITYSQLFELFNQPAQVVCVRVCKDLCTRRSLGYGYVNYSNTQDAARALEELNLTPVNGRPIKISYFHSDPRSWE